MKKASLISFKLQSYLALIPFFGFFIVVITSLYNIKKSRNITWMVIYYILTLPPLILIFCLMAFISKYFIIGKSLSVNTMCFLYTILLWGGLLLETICCVIIEKALIEKWEKRNDIL